MEGGRQPLITDYLNKLAEEREKQEQALAKDDVGKTEETQQNPEEEEDKIRGRMERQERTKDETTKVSGKVMGNTGE